MRYIVTVIALLILSSVSYAQGTGKVFLRGPGHSSCGQYLAAVQGHAPGTGSRLTDPNGQFYYDDHFRYMEWISGFLSAANWLVIDERNQLEYDYAATDVWIRKWCEQHPTNSLFAAAVSFVWDQRPEIRQKTK